MRAGTWHAAAQDRESRTRMRGRDGNFEWKPLSKDLNSLRNGTYKSTANREVDSLGSESIYTNTCQFEVRDQCFCTHFTRKGDHSRQQQTAISAYIAE